MGSVIASWTSQITGITSGVLGFCAAVAVIVLIVNVIRGLLGSDDRDMGQTILRCLAVVLFLIIAASASTIVGGVIPGVTP